MTFDLTVSLRTASDDPAVGITIIVSPDPINPTDTGTVVTTTSATTDANGHAVLQVLPSTVGNYYLMRFNRGTTSNVIAPFRFQMPAQAITLTNLLRNALTRNEPIPPSVQVNLPLGEDFQEDFNSDIDIPVSATANAFGDWVELWRLTHSDQDTALYNLTADLNFDPAWDHDNGDRAAIDIHILHKLPSGETKQVLVPHAFIYIRNQALHNDEGTSMPDTWAKLIEGESIVIEARASRQLTTNDGKRKIVLAATDSHITYAKFKSAGTSSTRVFVDPNTMLGTGSQADPIKPKIPYTQDEKDKLASVETGAQPPQSADDIVTKLEAQPTTPVDKRLHANAIQGLTQSNVQSLTDLSDVTITNPVDGQEINYEIASQRWVNRTPQDESLSELSDVTITNPADGDQVTYEDSSDKWINRSPHDVTPSLAQLTSVLEGAPENQKLRRIALRGETTVEGGVNLPNFADVPNWTLRVRQDTTADNPALYLTSADYDTPITNRNQVILSVNNSSLFSLNPQRGSSSDNYNQFVGTYSARARSGLGNVTIALYNDPPPPATIYIRGIAGQQGVIAVTHTGPGFINGRTYSVYSATVTESRVANTANTTQTLTFFADAAGSTPYNIKPSSQHHSRAWHLQSPVQPDYSVTDTQSPAFIRNKPVVTTIGRLIAVTANLPTIATAFSTAQTVARYSPHLTITGAQVTSGYTVSSNSVLSIQPYPVNQTGWIVRALTGDTELCRLVIPLTPTVQYVDATSILATTSVCGHTLMGTSNNLNYYLAYQAQAGNQARHAGAGTTATNIEIFVAINITSGNVTFPNNTTLEVREAVV